MFAACNVNKLFRTGFIMHGADYVWTPSLDRTEMQIITHRSCPESNLPAPLKVCLPELCLLYTGAPATAGGS